MNQDFSAEEAQRLRTDVQANAFAYAKLFANGGENWTLTLRRGDGITDSRADTTQTITGWAVLIANPQTAGMLIGGSVERERWVFLCAQDVPLEVSAWLQSLETPAYRFQIVDIAQRFGYQAAELRPLT